MIVRLILICSAIALIGCGYENYPGWTCDPYIDDDSVVFGTIAKNSNSNLVEYRLAENKLIEESRTNFDRHAFKIAPLQHGEGYIGFGYSTPRVQDNNTNHHVCLWYADSNKSVQSVENLTLTCTFENLSIFPKQRTAIAMHSFVDQNKEGADPVFSVLRVTGDSVAPRIEHSREVELSPKWGAVFSGAVCKANTRLGWYCVLSPEGYPKVWKVTEDSIQSIGNIALELPPNNKHGILDVDLSADLRKVAVCKTDMQVNNEATYCEVFLWDLQSGARIPISLRFDCTGFASIAFVDEQHFAIRLGNSYKVVNVLSGESTSLPSKVRSSKYSKLLVLQPNSFLLRRYDGRRYEYAVDTIER